MKSWKLAGALALGCAGLLAGAVLDRPVGAQDAVWLTNYEEARAAARKEGKPLFVVFRCER
ncbi:MAG: hypothetical protein HY321_00055 [Armatimonadetes bacterium]|nr:hypothetical protein [Armatimonadota bacterium]